MNSWLRDTLGPHMLGALIGGATIGLTLSALGAGAGHVIPRTVLVSSVLTVVALYAFADVASWRLWRPAIKRQVPDQFRKTPYHRTMAFLWGFDLGFGWSTHQPTTAMVTFSLSALLVQPTVAIAAGVVFAATRALTICVGIGVRDIRHAERRFDAVRSRVWLARLGSGAIGAVLATAALSTIT